MAPGVAFFFEDNMFTAEEHLDNLVNHIERVRSHCLRLGKKLIARGEDELGRKLIARGFKHDLSKFQGEEWKYLHVGPDVPDDKLQLAIRKHNHRNSHHPEYHGGVAYMGRLDVAEMVADWYARSSEQGTSLRDWITKNAVSRYSIDLNCEQWQWINEFVDLMLDQSFKKKEPAHA